jgi:hypothetical protein
MMKKLYPTVILLLALFPLYAQYEPPSGAGSIFDLYSPVFLGGGVSSIAPVSPGADALNPASSGAVQLPTFDFSYISLLGLGSEDGAGHVLNAGLTWPTRAGVLSGSAHFITSPFGSLDLGTLGAFNVSFAKDLFPDLLVGAGLGLVLGGDWGMGLDLGILHLAGDVKGLKDFQWGAAVRGIGKGYSPQAGRNSFPAPFTPVLGAAFTAMNREEFLWKAYSDVSLPAFQNLRLTVGSSLSYRDLLTVRLASTLDLMELVNGSSRSVPLSFGFSVGFDTSIRTQESKLLATAGAAPFRNGIWGIGAGVNIPVGLVDSKPPRIGVAAGDTEYISPNLDGVQDDLVKPLTITDERFVKGYRFIVTDAGGNTVREIVNKDERPENLTFRNIVSRLTYVKAGIAIPESLRWDGRDNAGAVVPDGTYTWRVEAWDDNDNLGRSPEGTVVVDNTPPSVRVSAPYLIFSPDGDGNKDELVIEQERLPRGPLEDLDPRRRGREVLGLTLGGPGTRQFRVERQDNEGAPVPDGVYSYHISATDRAGNSGGARWSNIIIDAGPRPSALGIDTPVFSPNGDGVKDTVTLSLNVPVRSRHRALAAGDPRRERRGAAHLPGGRRHRELHRVRRPRRRRAPPCGRGPTGRTWRSCTRTAATPEGASPRRFAIDLTPPSAAVTADLAVFSPDGDGNKDT